MIVCQECGNAAPSPDGFCSSCGVLLEWSGEAVATPPPPPPFAPALMVNGSGPALAVHTTTGTPAPAGVKPDDEASRPAPVPVAVDPGYDGLFCSFCGTRNADGRQFCRYCGHPLDVTVDTARKLRWWQRLFRRRSKATAAGDRPRNFRQREVPTGDGASSDGASKKKRKRRHLPSRLPLSRFAPVLIVLGLVGIGLGPARQWLTQRADSVLGKASHRLHESYAPVVPVSASASSAAHGHKAALAIDGVKDTWWQSADHPEGIGESITVRFANPTNVDSIGVLSGVGGDKYRSQARPQTITITANGKPGGQISFKDKADFQTAKVSLHGITSITLVITASYPGQLGHAVALREVQFFVLT